MSSLTFQGESDKAMKKLEIDFQKTSEKLKLSFDNLKKKSRLLRAEVDNVRDLNNRHSSVDGRVTLNRRKALREKLNEVKISLRNQIQILTSF